MLLLDVDAVCKLANWQLLAFLPELTKTSLDQMMAVSSLIHRARRSLVKLDTKLFVHEDRVVESIEFLENTAKLPEANPEKLAIFQDSVDIDVGEAILFSIMLEHSNALMLTGDKRALRGLSALPHELRSALVGRVIIIEQVVLTALSSYGLKFLRDRICPHRSIDKAIANAMGSQCDAVQAAVEEGLQSYISELSARYEPSILATFT